MKGLSTSEVISRKPILDQMQSFSSPSIHKSTSSSSSSAQTSILLKNQKGKGSHLLEHSAHFNDAHILPPGKKLKVLYLH